MNWWCWLLIAVVVVAVFIMLAVLERRAKDRDAAINAAMKRHPAGKDLDNAG